MKAVILAGGLGTRLSEETSIKPKPMVEVGGMPILWHIMKSYSYYGVNEFIICCGYKGHVIKEFFSNYVLRTANVTFDMVNNTMTVHDAVTEPWKVTLVDTGENTLTGGRLKRVRPFLGDDTFCFTYGDGVSDIDIGALIDFHKSQGNKATLTAVQPPGRFGAIVLGPKDSKIHSFYEKPTGDGAWINGGYFVLEPSVIDYIADDSTTWEQEPMKLLAQDGELNAFKHTGFWQPMDTLRDKMYLEDIWISGKAPWKKW
ncbi:MAG: glucose-1-phosphate cytidylyltransferase [Marinagarivorans sp.]|nr:glucose-1-phosphate cytidylyltransferase [Marinagarivorans sp.]